MSDTDEGSTTEEEGESVDVPEDVLAVLREEVDLKTKQMIEERVKLQKTCDDKDDEISDLEQIKTQLEEKVVYPLDFTCVQESYIRPICHEMEQT